MARRQAIEPEELFETANRLKAEGKEVTALALIEALGGGSFRTIYKYLEIWEKNRPAEVINTPDEIPPQVLASFSSAWRLALQESKREVEAIKAQAKEDVAAALRQFHGALEAIDKLEKEREAELEALEGLQKVLAENKAELSKAEIEMAADKARIEELREQLKEQKAEKDAATKEAAALKGQVSTLESQNQKLMEKLG